MSKHSILIVDDEPTILDLIREILESEGFTVLVAPSGVVALHLLQQTPVSLVLTDLMMPQLNGMDLARRLRADPKTAQIPLVLMSAALPTGVSDMFVEVLPKPFPIEKVVQLVRRCLGA
ncbi:MAG: response regulator [Chloroflexales bacterium]|nr:response regulator [Chloroflexales bacterium]